MSIKKSIYEEIQIESNDQKKTVDLRFGVASVDYYEDIFSPTITARIVVANTAESVQGSDNEGNPNGPLQSIYNGLPLRGGERVSLKIAGNSSTNPGLDFATNPEDYFYVSSITNVVSDTLKESFTLNLVSREAITNETTRVGKKYNTTSPIHSSVRDIIENYLKTTKIEQIDDAKNKYGFIANRRKPFTLLTWLSSKAVPVSSNNSSAGFLFYQTQDGFNFRSIDGLITQEKRKTFDGKAFTYVYSDVNESDYDRDNSFNILQYATNRNQNLLEKLRLGTYSSLRIYYNPYNFSFTREGEGVFTQKDYTGKKKNPKNLGQDLELPRISNSSNIGLGDIPSRLITQILDIGTLETDVSTETNSNPQEYQSQALMRYNTLFTQTLSMTIPSNTNLRAGDIIECEFPKIVLSDGKEFDDDQSGLYIIKELCHHFDTEGSYTSMKLVRDTFGRHGTNTKQ
jgi:hypothetical protein